MTSTTPFQKPPSAQSESGVYVRQGMTIETIPGTAAPKIIWTYWDQGIGQAPPVVRTCLQSWEQKNPGWTLRILDRDTLGNYTRLAQEIDLTRDDISLAKVSNLVRLYLLHEHGGVWADSTLFCSIPLDEWLPEYLSTGYFAFRHPGRDRLLSSWFMAAEPNNPLLAEYRARYRDLFKDNIYFLQNTFIGKRIRRTLKLFLSRNVAATRHWLSWPVRRLLRVYPYYNVHYTFNAIVLDGGEPARIWNEGKIYTADDPHFLLRAAERREGIDLALDFIASGRCPVHKLKWGLHLENDYWQQVMQFLAAPDDLRKSFSQ